MAFVADTRMIAFLDHLDQHPLHHIIALRQNEPVQRDLVNATRGWGLHEEDGTPVESIELN